MRKLCIIPARGGSQRIPRKNIKSFYGKPIIAYSILSALESGLFDEVMVSTDDEEIADISRSYGASIPFLRSKKTSDEFASTFEVIEEVINEYKKLGMDYEYTCCLYATAPFVTPDKLITAFRKLKENKSEAAFTVLEYSYPVQRALQFSGDNLEMKWPENLKKRSQDFKKTYHDAGQFYMYNTIDYLNKGGVFKMKSTAIIVSELVAQDIDTETDWKLAELKYELMVKRVQKEGN